jgi:hypothetical protein
MRLPDMLIPGAVLLEWLSQNGHIERFAKHFRVVRQGGYCARDMIVFLVLYFASRCRSLGRFAEFLRPWRAQLAAPVGLRSMPHQSSVSRFCRAVEANTLRETSASSWLLFDVCGGAELLRHPSTGHRDAIGRRWDVFDFDPSVLSIRQRGLPHYHDVPDGRRRSEQAVPGYTGRHRGEVTISRMLLRHSGSGLWLNCEVHPGNGDLRGAFERCAQTVASVCDSTGIERERAILRCDGAFGSVPYVALCEEHDLAFVTRLSHYGLFERDEIEEHLAQATWRRAQDSMSGPLREAAELGEVTLIPAPKTRKADGTQFGPVKVRVVTSRTYTDNDNGAGILIGGKLYELFGTSLRPDGWPPEDVVSLYSGRADIENGINQAHQLCDLDRVLSHHIPGQELMTTVGLFVYNLQTVLGTKIEGMPGDIAAQTQRTRSPEEQPRNTTSEDPPTSCDAVAPSGRPRATSVQLGDEPSDASPSQSSLPEDEVVTPHAAEQHGAPGDRKETRRIQDGLQRDATADREDMQHDTAPRSEQTRPPQCAVESATAELGKTLDELDWKRILNRLDDGWKRPSGKPFLVCPEGRPLSPLRPEHDHSRPLRRRLVLLASRSDCRPCPRYRACAEPRMERRIRTCITVEQANRIDRAIVQLRHAKKEDRARRCTQKSQDPKLRTTPEQKKPRHSKGYALPWQPLSEQSTQPRFELQTPLFLSAEARRVAREEFGRIEIEVSVTSPAPTPGPRLVAVSTSQRQCRRQSWQQRHRYNALSDEARVDVRANVTKRGAWVAALYQAAPTGRVAA